MNNHNFHGTMRTRQYTRHSGKILFRSHTRMPMATRQNDAHIAMYLTRNGEMLSALKMGSLALELLHERLRCHQAPGPLDQFGPDEDADVSTESWEVHSFNPSLLDTSRV